MASKLKKAKEAGTAGRDRTTSKKRETCSSGGSIPSVKETHISKTQKMVKSRCCEAEREERSWCRVRSHPSLQARSRVRRCIEVRRAEAQHSLYVRQVK